MLVSAEIEALISRKEVKSGQRERSIYTLTTYDDPALLKKENFTLICRQCSPSYVCTRHAHITFCSPDVGIVKRGNFLVKRKRLIT